MALANYLWLALGWVTGLVAGWVWAEAPLKRKVAVLERELARERQLVRGLALVLEKKKKE